MPDGEQDREVGRHVAVFEEFSHDIVHFRVQVELGIGELDSEAAPHSHLAFVFEFSRLVDTSDLDVATFDLLRKVGLDLLEFVTETPRVDRLGLDDAREAVGSSDVAALLARRAVLARALDVFQESAETLVGVVAEQRRPGGDTAYLDVASEAEAVGVLFAVERLHGIETARCDGFGVFMKQCHSKLLLVGLCRNYIRMGQSREISASRLVGPPA